MSNEEFEMIALETARKSRQLDAEWEIISVVMAVLAFLMVAATLYLMWCAHRDHKARKRGVWGEFRPTVTDDVQVIDGVEWHRMGVPGRR